MNILPKAVTKVVESFERLPGIGPKTASRLGFYLLHVPQAELDRFAESIATLKKNTLLCSVCKNVAEIDPCVICNDPSRDHTQICVVEQINDVLSIERTGRFKGVYHVLHGILDPLNNIGPDEIYIADLVKRVTHAHVPVRELILAMNPTMEGEATSLYIQKLLIPDNQQLSSFSLTRLAHGLPVGADIEYADEVTLSRALEGRRAY